MKKKKDFVPEICGESDRIGALLPCNPLQILLLEETYKMMEAHGYEVGNIDAIILAERPKMAPHIPLMKENIARALHTDISRINIKATRGEKLGFVGREEGIVSMSVCLIEEKR